MKTLAIAFLLLFVCLSCNETTKKETRPASEATVYYLIRHAEKDRSNPEDKDPQLTAAGLTRAQGWVNYFDSIPLDQVFSTAYARTQQTASYTAASKNLPMELYEVGSLYTDDFKALTKGQQVLIVGHSNTTPALVNKIIGQETYVDMQDNDNSSLYKVTIQDGEARVQVIKVGTN